MRIVVVADPLESLDAATDTSVGVMHAAQDRGIEVWVTEAGMLEAVDGRARVIGRQVRLAPSHPAGAGRWTVTSEWFNAGDRERIWLDEAGIVFMRTEPPLDSTYVTATLILDLLDPARTPVVNNPSGLRACSEHLMPLRFPDLIAPTIVTADRCTIHDFVDRHRIAVLKPVDGFGGRGVFRLDCRDPNLASLTDMCTAGGTRAVIVQRFLREVADGNKRIVLIDGSPVAAVYRYPAPGDFRIGEPAGPAPITGRDREICRRLAPDLDRHGIRLAGLDVIGSHLIEVNVTSVGALRKADALLGTTLCADVLDRVLATLTTRTPQ